MQFIVRKLTIHQTFQVYSISSILVFLFGLHSIRLVMHWLAGRRSCSRLSYTAHRLEGKIVNFYLIWARKLAENTRLMTFVVDKGT